MTRKSVRQRALSGETILGAMIFEFFVPGMPQMLRNAGAEYAIYDMENGGLGLETLKMLAAASRGTGVVPMVRVPRGSWVQACRDCGVQRPAGCYNRSGALRVIHVA